MTSTLIVDDEPDIRFLLQTLIDLADGGLFVVAEARDGAGAISKWREYRPDVIVLDHRMPDMTGLEAAEVILGEDPAQTIVMYTAHLEDIDLAHAGRLGVQTCVAKGDFHHVLRVLRAMSA